MMPRIEAQETLAAYNRSALCHNVGFENEADRQRVIAQIERRATGALPQQPTKAAPADFAAMGIGLSQVDGDLPVIGDLAEWLGQSPSSSEAVGEPENG